MIGSFIWILTSCISYRGQKFSILWLWIYNWPMSLKWQNLRMLLDLYLNVIQRFNSWLMFVLNFLGRNLCLLLSWDALNLRWKFGLFIFFNAGHRHWKIAKLWLICLWLNSTNFSFKWACWRCYFCWHSIILSFSCATHTELTERWLLLSCWWLSTHTESSEGRRWLLHFILSRLRLTPHAETSTKSGSGFLLFITFRRSHTKTASKRWAWLLLIFGFFYLCLLHLPDFVVFCFHGMMHKLKYEIGTIKICWLLTWRRVYFKSGYSSCTMYFFCSMLKSFKSRSFVSSGPEARGVGAGCYAPIEKLDLKDILFFTLK